MSGLDNRRDFHGLVNNHILYNYLSLILRSIDRWNRNKRNKTESKIRYKHISR